MTSYTEDGTNRACTAQQLPATPSAVEWLAIMGARASNIWAEPSNYVVRYDDTGEIAAFEAAYFAAHFTAVP